MSLHSFHIFSCQNWVYCWTSCWTSCYLHFLPILNILFFNYWTTKTLSACCTLSVLKFNLFIQFKWLSPITTAYFSDIELHLYIIGFQRWFYGYAVNFILSILIGWYNITFSIPIFYNGFWHYSLHFWYRVAFVHYCFSELIVWLCS